MDEAEAKDVVGTSSKTTRYQKKLQTNFAEIDQLIQTPEIMREAAMDSLKKLNTDRWLHQDKQALKNTIQVLENINKTSLKRAYQIIYNQACVLAVSSLCATFEEYFINYINANWPTIKDIETDNIKFTLSELAQIDFKLLKSLGWQILQKEKGGINFQDLGSTVRTFEKYKKCSIQLDKETKDKIIFYQQVRHLIVHNNGIVSPEFIHRTRDGGNIRDLKIGEKIELNEEDWKEIKSTFNTLVGIITEKVKKA